MITYRTSNDSVNNIMFFISVVNLHKNGSIQKLEDRETEFLNCLVEGDESKLRTILQKHKLDENFLMGELDTGLNLKGKNWSVSMN